MEDIYLLAKAVKQQQAMLRIIVDLACLPAGHSAPGLRAAVDRGLDRADELLKRVDTHVERG